ncbi:uncharacterized protein LOC130770808 isoform X1 [Actinidia eriantha]|uniref:uncharacterized protein LOC130770808 isoform X1 n=1 Tax=Actinidia eriantha TaxID=165200 RepID=UPI00258F5CCB|nr:uncharacterized protein LOC130770808 isoform X1 [Actinidia eriantha]
MIEYDQTPYVHFFLCRQCRAHIALAGEHVFTDIMIDVAVFRNTVNVDIEDDPRHYKMSGNRTVADASCTRCMMVLGFKFVEVPDADAIVQVRRFLLYLKKLLVWDGSQILYAHNSCPIEQSESEEESDRDG